MWTTPTCKANDRCFLTSVNVHIIIITFFLSQRYTYIPWNDHSRKVLLLRWGSCAACGLATEGENLFTIRFWRFWTRNTKSWRHRNTIKKQEMPNLENILFISSSENLKDNFRPVQKLMGRVVRQPKFIWIKTIKAIELRSSWWSRSCSCFESWWCLLIDKYKGFKDDISAARDRAWAWVEVLAVNCFSWATYILHTSIDQDTSHHPICPRFVVLCKAK